MREADPVLAEAARLLADRRLALEEKDARALERSLDRQMETERRLADRVASGAIEKTPALLDRLRELRGEAFLAARLAQSRLLYLRWLELARRPPLAYGRSGGLVAGESRRTAWEA